MRGIGKRNLNPRHGWRAWTIGGMLMALTALLTLGVRTCNLMRMPDGHMALVSVADGDSMTLRDNKGRHVRVRMIGIDTPELGTAASFRSALFAAELLESAQRIRLEPDPDKPMDKFGRTLGWVWLTDAEGNETLLNEVMIKSGHADLYRDVSPKAKYYKRLVR
jgi:endonuclease YncB( thermonuclease family)